MKIILAKIGWGDSYDSETKLVGGGYLSGSDRFTFQIASDGLFYGFFPVGKGHNRLNLKRVDEYLESKEGVDGIDVIWVATRPETGGQYIVGWYKDATLFADVHKRPDHGHYRVCVDPAMCSLIPISERDFKITPGVISGQSCVRYYPSKPDPQVQKEFQRIQNYVRGWHISSESAGSKAAKPAAEREAEAQLEREQGFQSDAKLRVLIEKYAEKLVVEQFSARGIDLEPHPKPQWPWDFKYMTEKGEFFVEVKGTQGDGGTFLLTENEVQRASEDSTKFELWIVCNIRVNQTDPVSLSGGKLIPVSPWNPNEHGLTPIQYRCKRKI